VSRGVGLDEDARQPDPVTGPAGGLSPVAPAGAADEPDLDAALQRARAGDEDGFLVLWRTLQPPLLRYLRLRAPDGGADDVAADTWLSVVRGLERFTGDAAEFRAWLFTIARNRAVDAARARAARPVTLMGDIRSVADVVSTLPVTSSAEAQALERFSTRQALALLATLPDDIAEMVALRVVADLDVAAVASIVGRSPGAVRVAVHRGLRALASAGATEVGS
jgi:RNA polymerase sigma-70 factor (ECF subfamily)